MYKNSWYCFKYGERKRQSDDLLYRFGLILKELLVFLFFSPSLFLFTILCIPVLNVNNKMNNFLSFFVSVPPNIDDSLSSTDVIVREGANVKLNCHASGSPPPSVKWRRDDGTKININKSLSGK